MARRKEYDGDLTTKDMSVLREMDDTKSQMEKRIGTVKDYSLKHRITVTWDLNEEATQDRMVKLTFDDQVAIIDAEELQRYLRWV